MAQSYQFRARALWSSAENMPLDPCKAINAEMKVVLLVASSGYITIIQIQLERAAFQ